MIKRKYIIITAVIIFPVLFFWFGRFHFSKYYFFGRDIRVEKISKIECGFWKDYDCCNLSFLDDFLICNEIHWNNDTLYVNGKPKGKVIRLVHRFYSKDYILTLQSLDGQHTGLLISK